MKQFLPLIGIVLLASTASAQATFTSVPSPSAGFTGASKDGTFHAGPSFNANEAFVWSSGGGLVSVATPGSSGTIDVSDNGLTIAGTFDNGGNDEAAILTGGVTTFLGGLASQSGNSVSSMYAMNTDGTVVVGLGWVTAGQAHGFKWVSGVMNDLGSLNATRSSRANNVSDDGNVVVGWDEHLTGFRRPSYWTGAVETLMVDDPGEAWAVNDDGSVIAGTWNGDCFRWDAVNGMVNLGKLPGSDPLGDDAFGVSVSDDGNTIVGWNGNAFFGTPFRAFIWRPGAGMVVLEDLLVALGASGASGANLTFANTVSADGRTISGTAGSFPFPVSSWVATLPEVATTYCTAKLNSAGCTPAIAFEGTPSASSGSGFVITGNNVMANSTGLLIYSKTGPAALPFYGGTLCLAGQIKRTAGQNSGGTTGCTGTLSLDFNAQVALGSDAALIGGASVWAQFWSRDQGFSAPNNVGLTDAVEFVLWP